MFADAPVFGAFAFGADMQVEGEAQVQWLRVGGLLELHDDVVAFACRQLGFADEHVAFLLERQFYFAVFGFRRGRDDLLGGGNGFEIGVVERAGHWLVLLDEKLGARGFVFEALAAFWSANGFLGGNGGKSCNADERQREAGTQCVVNELDVFYVSSWL